MAKKQRPGRELEAAFATHVGRVREQNEDAGLVDEGQGLLIVADGMGGHQAGEVASRFVIDALPGMIQVQLAKHPPPSSEQIRAMLQEVVTVLSWQLCQHGIKHPELTGMGATVVAALIRGGMVHIVHLGDSRTYLLRNGQLALLTDDHSFVGMLIREGQLTVAEAKTHPARGWISRFVGMPDEAQPEVRSMRLRKGDRLLLCSDGLNAMIADDQIGSILKENAAAQAAADALIQAANEAGGRDNTTVIVADYR